MIVLFFLTEVAVQTLFIQMGSTRESIQNVFGKKKNYVYVLFRSEERKENPI